MTPGRERIVRFGVKDSLVGILSTPRTPRLGAPYVVLVNAGVAHRVGPNRLYVDIARAVSAEGFNVLRFDLSGLGDSNASAEGLSLTDAAVGDVRTALDYLQRSRRADTFVLCGLCSGANYSLITAFHDPRVVGVSLIDPSVSRTLRSTAIHYLRRIVHLETWRLVVRLKHPVWSRARRRLRFRAAREAAEQLSEQELDRGAEPDFGPETRRLLRQMIDRGTELLVVFTGGVNGQYNYRNQLFDLLPGLDFKGRLRLEFLPDTDHAVSDTVNRTSFLTTMTEWLGDAAAVTEQKKAASS